MTSDGETKIRYLYDLLRLPMHDKCMVTISWPRVHNSTFLNVEGHLPLFRSLDYLVKTLLDGFAIGRREGLFTHLDVISRLLFLDRR